ncbi:hypothetical protein O5542_29900, partial [Escherichia coli]|nr:hypothetical protein [Escherichia coli]
FILSTVVLMFLEAKTIPHSRTSSSERFDIMLLIAQMLQLTCWLAGVDAQKQGGDNHFQANTVRNRNVLTTLRLGMEGLRHSGYT